jgi:parallel beta-helix repeat protein
MRQGFGFAITLVLAATGFAAQPSAVVASTTFVVNRIGDQPDLNLANAACDVSSNSGSQCTLRAAIQEANDTSGADTINFNITSTSKTITPATPMPPITGPVTINGYSQANTKANTKSIGNDAVIKIVLDGINAGATTDGLVFDASDSLVKGLVIQRFGDAGIVLNGSDNRVQGNFIGTNGTATEARPNKFGVAINGPNSLVGGTGTGARNVISGNLQDGVGTYGDASTGTRIQGNYIGTNRTGITALANKIGVALRGVGSNVVGGDVAGARNVISGNGADEITSNGIYLSSSPNNVIQGNYIGTNAAGNGAVPNGRGINGGGENTVIGGTSAARRNVISGNLREGIDLFNSGGTVIQGNYIGRNAANNGNLGNGDGIVMLSTNTTIGGSASGTANLITANTDTGITVLAGNNTIRGNVITGNGDIGVLLGVGPAHPENAGPNTIAGNVIVGNADHGVMVLTAGVGQQITANQILGNGGLGINLSGGTQDSFGVTSNDTGDGDGGANRLQNYPVLSSALRSNSTGVTAVSASLNSVASTEFRVELYFAVADSSGHGEAQVLLSSKNITTNASGDGNFSFALGGLSPGQVLTALAIRTGTGDTSEFSANVSVITAP